MRTSLTLALAAILCTLLSVPIVQAEEGRLQIGQIKPTNRRAEETEENAELRGACSGTDDNQRGAPTSRRRCNDSDSSRCVQGRDCEVREETCESPTPQRGRRQRRFVQKFAKAMKKFKKNGRARRVEEDDTDYHIDSLMGLVNGRNGFPPNPVAM
ncbi:hypothetical protein PC128_g8071 [Phytophthora cactorum]|nr:hypothetical protein PC120_g13194 [Phytophthora cactorum]KAG3057929.1 hypothetical protein PC121_g14618 [Phytophthora cactorum]KAG3195966.1 hypothetical protein PC128_g8071 [Phytophthora cactorum]KAG4050440.1 hypothetical protein PC123_g14333 [Phytophthora cactorum]